MYGFDAESLYIGQHLNSNRKSDPKHFVLFRV